MTETQLEPAQRPPALSPPRPPGFCAGFRFGLGVAAAQILVVLVLGAGAAGAAYYAYGSLQGALEAGATRLTRAYVEPATRSLTETRDRARREVEEAAEAGRDRVRKAVDWFKLGKEDPR